MEFHLQRYMLQNAIFCKKIRDTTLLIFCRFYSGTEPKTEKDHFLRLSWAHVSRADIAEGVQLLCKTIRENSENKRC